jgi:hypothetical protein
MPVIILLPLLLLAAVIAGGCNSMFGRTWTSTYEDTPLTFSVTTDSSDAVWGRARSWFGDFNTPRLSVDSDTLLQSAETQTGKGHYVLAIERRPSNDTMHFAVTFTPSNPKDKAIVERATDRAHELAYIARTGDNQQAFVQRGAR